MQDKERRGDDSHINIGINNLNIIKHILITILDSPRTMFLLEEKRWIPSLLFLPPSWHTCNLRPRLDNGWRPVKILLLWIYNCHNIRSYSNWLPDSSVCPITKFRYFLYDQLNIYIYICAISSIKTILRRHYTESIYMPYRLILICLNCWKDWLFLFLILVQSLLCHLLS